jgi:AcrR family transcriptional regulator
MVLTSPNAILTSDGEPLAEVIARQKLAKREAQYASEVRRLIDAGRDTMRACGTTSSPRVADIVAAAGLSNDAFYRHFPSKAALVAAIIEDGAARLGSYLAHQMAKESTPEGQVRAWVRGVMSQAADDDVATTTRAVLWNGARISDGLGPNRPSHAATLGQLLHDPFAALGSDYPSADAALAAHATIGVLSDYLGQGVRPTRSQIDHVTEFCIAAIARQPRNRQTTRRTNRSLK